MKHLQSYNRGEKHQFVTRRLAFIEEVAERQKYTIHVDDIQEDGS
jgi:hypothetical protein